MNTVMHDPEDKLPSNYQYVLVYLPNKPWTDNHTKIDHKWKVAQFIRGLTQKERELLPDDDRRKITYCAEDEHGNNTKGYCWEEFGTDTYSGSAVSMWTELPKI